MSSSSDVDTINSHSADPVPAISIPLSTDIKLLRGIREQKEDGTIVWHDVAHVKELTGADEEYLASVERKEGITYTEYMTALLDRTVTSIGVLEVSKHPGMLNKLILADRDILFLGVVRATYGIKRDIRAFCNSCGQSNDVEINLDEDFPIVQPNMDVRDPLEVKVRNGVVKLRLPNGEDTVAAQKKAKSDAEINTAMLARCAVWEDGEAPEDPMEWARSLNVADRRKLVNTLLAFKAGPSLEGVDTQCASCGENMPIAVDWVSLLFS